MRAWYSLLIMGATIVISKRKIRETDGVVVLPVVEYRRLLEQGVPTHHLTDKEAEAVDRLVGEGLQEYREGKTISAPSLGDALKIYGRCGKTH